MDMSIETLSAASCAYSRERLPGTGNYGRQGHDEAGDDELFFPSPMTGTLAGEERKAVVAVSNVFDPEKSRCVDIRHQGRVVFLHDFPHSAACGLANYQLLKTRSVQAGTTAKQMGKTLASRQTFTGSRLVNKTLQAGDNRKRVLS